MVMIGASACSTALLLFASPRQPAPRCASTDSKPLGASVGEAAFDVVSGWSEGLVDIKQDEEQVEDTVSLALQRMQRDMSMLDLAAGATPQLSGTELLLLGTSVSLSAFSPFGLSAKAVEVLVPSMSALCAAIGFSAEYTGKVADARG